MTDRYRTLVRPLPRPTPAQTDAFVDFVAGAHSWYKHLSPFPPGAPFAFFLDPNAGRSLLRTPTGESAFVDRTDERDRFHYTWMLTSEYRERFGHWEYTSDHAPRFLSGSPRAGWQDLWPRVRVLDEGGDWLEVPPSLSRAGACRLTALVHERLPPTVVFHSMFEERIVEFRRYSGRNPDDPEVVRYLPFLRVADDYAHAFESDARSRADAETLDEGWERRMTAFHERERPRQRELIRSALHSFLSALDGSPAGRA